MYLGDPRESLVDLNAPGVWEADNRTEERWQWGAQVLDLCGLSPEEYKNSTAVTVKTIQDCGECGGGSGSGETGTTENKGEASFSDSGIFEISFKSPVATEIYITVKFKDSNMREGQFIVPVEKDSTSASYDISDMGFTSPYEIISAKVGFKPDGSDASDKKSDGKYDYSVDFEGSVTGKTFVLSILCTETNNLTGDDYAEIIRNEGQGFDYVASYGEVDFGDESSAEIMFYVPCEYAPEIQIETPEEEEYFENNSYDFVIVTQNEVDAIKQVGQEDTSNWVYGTVMIDGSSFSLYVRRDLTGAQCSYSNTGECDGDDIKYSLEIKK